MYIVYFVLLSTSVTFQGGEVGRRDRQAKSTRLEAFHVTACRKNNSIRLILEIRDYLGRVSVQHAFLLPSS
jgi:hypothetical protein